VSLIYHQVCHEVLSAPIKGETSIGVDGMPSMEARDVPFVVHKVGLVPALEKVMLDQFSNIEDVDWIFFNSIHGLQSKVHVLIS